MFLNVFASNFGNMLHIKLSFRRYAYTFQIILLRSRSRSLKQEIDSKYVAVPHIWSYFSTLCYDSAIVLGLY